MFVNCTSIAAVLGLSCILSPLPTTGGRVDEPVEALPMRWMIQSPGGTSQVNFPSASKLAERFVTALRGAMLFVVAGKASTATSE